MTGLHEFDELMLFAQIKAKPGLYLGHNSLLSLRDYLFGMQHVRRVMLELNTESKDFRPEDFAHLDAFQYQVDRMRNF